MESTELQYVFYLNLGRCALSFTFTLISITVFITFRKHYKCSPVHFTICLEEALSVFMASYLSTWCYRQFLSWASEGHHARRPADACDMSRRRRLPPRPRLASPLTSSRRHSPNYFHKYSGFLRSWVLFIIPFFTRYRLFLSIILWDFKTVRIWVDNKSSIL